MISRDGAGLDSASETSKRWKLLRDQGIELDVVVIQRIKGHWEDGKLRVFGAGGGYLSRFIKGYKEAITFVENADMISAQDPFELGLIAFLLSRKFHIKFEIQDHGGFFDGETNNEPLWFLRKFIAYFFMRRANGVRTVSPKSLERLKIMRSGFTYFLPIAVQNDFFEAEYKPEPNMIVTVSRLVEVKRVDFFIRAFHEALKINALLKLIIVGDGHLREALESLTRELQISDVVTFVGHANPKPFLEKASLFVLTSKHEGWGVAAVEAAVIGVPVLMSDTGCARWLEERTDASVIPRDADEDALARQLARMVEERHESKMISGIRMQETIEKQARVWQELLSVIK